MLELWVVILFLALKRSLDSPDGTTGPHARLAAAALQVCREGFPAMLKHAGLLYRAERVS